MRAPGEAVRQGRPAPTLPSARRLAKPIEIDPELPTSFYAVIGLRVLNGFALRLDRLERVAAAARRFTRQGPFPAVAELATTVGVDPPALRGVLGALGYRIVIGAGEETFAPQPQRRRETAKGSRKGRQTGEGHPFAKLRELKLA